jgi:hypothetical protein
MELVVNQAVYRCGHAYPAVQFDERKEHLAELVATGQTFLCPDCCRAAFALLELNCEAYANLQQMSPDMNAFVIEVTRVISPLSDILALNDYQERAPSVDELTPGGEPLDLPHTVWRKEFWFANDTNPVHVVMLMEHVKQEITWLASYMPSGKSAAHFGQFVEL